MNAQTSQLCNYVNDGDAVVHDVHIDDTVVHDVNDAVASDLQEESYTSHKATVVRPSANEAPSRPTNGLLVSHNTFRHSRWYLSTSFENLRHILQSICCIKFQGGECCIDKSFLRPARYFWSTSPRTPVLIAACSV